MDRTRILETDTEIKIETMTLNRIILSDIGRHHDNMEEMAKISKRKVCGNIADTGDKMEMMLEVTAMCE
jgi:hypothetical protein